MIKLQKMQTFLEVTKAKSPAPEVTYDAVKIYLKSHKFLLLSSISFKKSDLIKAFETRDIKCFRDMLKDVDLNLVDSKTGLSIFGKILKAKDADGSTEFIRECLGSGANLNLVRKLCFITSSLNI